MTTQDKFVTSEVINLDPGPSRASSPHAYLAVRRRLTQLLIAHTLVESYHRFRKFAVPYPFLAPASLRPGAMGTTREYKLHHSALVVLMDGEMPEKLRKHFRCRMNNQVNRKNIASLAPGLPALKDYDHASRRVNHERFDSLLRTLMPMDFSLLIQKAKSQESGAREFQLTHFHVKIERLTDGALRSLGIQLGYLQKGLYERGEGFVDDLEKKFFEYFNFYHNASGRRSAAALASQVLSRDRKTGTVFVSSQQDRRLTLLSSTSQHHDIGVEQYLLFILNEKEMAAFGAWGEANGIDFIKGFVVCQLEEKGIVVLRVRYEHTEAAMPSPDRAPGAACLNPREKWVRICEKAIMPLHEEMPYAIRYPLHAKVIS
ncbi:MAG: hypothetical protein HQL66_14535 [Magnetococcales bacterium]|nr:hypothetical protein [Magnetococcales bacterium]